MKTIRSYAWLTVLASSVVMSALLAISMLFGGANREFLPDQGLSTIQRKLPEVSFELTDQNGRRVTAKTFANRPLLVFFGFTNCPDVCPTTLSDMAGMLAEVGAEAERVQVLFITVDPERDTPELLRDYVSVFDKKFTGLAGTPEETRRAAEASSVYYKKVPGREAGSYSMDHTATVLLFDSAHRFVGTLDRHDDRNASLAKVRRLARS